MTDSRQPLAMKFGAVILVALMVACAWLSPFDTRANAHVDAGLKRAVATYATARALNALISVAQGTEISLAPVGIGVTLTPGQILDPVNDLVEQFSHVMLMAMVAFGIQKVLLVVGASWMISLTLTVIALAWSIAHLRAWPNPRWLSQLLWIFLLVRFALPLALITTEAVFQQFLAADYQESEQVLKIAQGEAGKGLAATPGADDKALFWERFKNAASDTLGDARTRIEGMKLAAEKAIDRIVRLIVIFTLETLLIPILLVWILRRVCRDAFAATLRPTRN